MEIKMNKVIDYTEDSAYTFLRGRNDKEIDNLIEKYGCDEYLIESELEKKYPKEEFFVLVDYIDDRNNGYFHIRVWGYEIELKGDLEQTKDI